VPFLSGVGVTDRGGCVGFSAWWSALSARVPAVVRQAPSRDLHPLPAGPLRLAERDTGPRGCSQRQLLGRPAPYSIVAPTTTCRPRIRVVGSPGSQIPRPIKEGMRVGPVNAPYPARIEIS